MTGHPADVIARTLLYEGYLLYPYRPSALKNQHRFNFGVLYPESFCVSGNDSWRLQTECPVYGDGRTEVEVRVRFLQLIERQSPGEQFETWHEAVADGRPDLMRSGGGVVEREVLVERTTIASLQQAAKRLPFGFPRAGDDFLRGDIEVSVSEVRAGHFKLTVRVSNQTVVDASPVSRNDALPRSLVSAHVVVTAVGGDLISLMDPPEAFREIAAACSNVGVWPVLVGADGAHDCMLASPIILSDYPQIAPESAGDLFDSTEIDEILALRILTLTDEEKREAGGSDERVRELLERTEALSPEHWAKLHGVVRGLRRVTAGNP